MFAGSFVKLAGNKAGTIPLARHWLRHRDGSFPSRCYVSVDVVVVNDYNNSTGKREETSLKVTSP